jgi:tetratricopeptide (TPR) repeat protein
VRILSDKAFQQSPPATQRKELQEDLQAMQKCNYIHDTVYALILRKIGFTYYNEKDFARSVQFTRSAVEVLQSNKDLPNRQKILARCYMNLETYYDCLNLVYEKNKALDDYMQLALKDTGDNTLITQLANRVDELYNNGDYIRCIHYADIADRVYHQETGLAENHYLDILTNKLNSLIALKKFDECDKILQEKKGELTRFLAYEQGNLYSLQGHIAEGKGQIDQSLDYFRKAFAINVKKKFKPGCTQTLNDIGFVYLSCLHSPTRALPYFQSALRYADSVESVNIYDNIAGVYVAQQRYDSAFHYFQKGLDQLRPGLHEQDLLAYPLAGSKDIMSYIVELLLNKADAFLASALVRQAIDLYKITDKLLDRIRAEQAEMGSQLFWRADTHRLYDRAITASYTTGNIEEAFYFFEKSRAVLLNDQLQELRRSDPDDVLKQAQAQKTAHLLEKQLDTLSPGTPAYKEVQDRLFTIRQQSNALLLDIRKRNPLHGQDSEDTSLIKIADIQKRALSDGQALLELFAGDSAIYIFTLTAHTSHLSRIAPAIYDSLGHLYMSCLADPRQLNSRFSEFTRASRQLYQLIFGGQPRLPDRIIISPDGDYFPFEPLIVNGQGQQPHYFIEDHAVSYTYSARYLLNEFGNAPTTQPAGSFLGIAPVQFAPYLHLPALTASDRSLHQLNDYFRDGDQLVDTQATLANFQHNFPRYKVLQLYTHATSTSADGYPMIYFADSALPLPELVSDSKPATTLVVLSACETGSGNLYKGEGIFSFNRGFAALGIPACVTNLWSVDNLSTYRLTELFYKHLTEGIPSDVALQKAKKDFLQQGSKEQRLPYYWAAAILVGKSAILDQTAPRQHGNKVVWIIAALFVLFMIPLAIYSRLNKPS